MALLLLLSLLGDRNSLLRVRKQDIVMRHPAEQGKVPGSIHSSVFEAVSWVSQCVWKGADNV